MTEAEREEIYADVNRAISRLLDDGEISISWCLVIDVTGPDKMRYLAHRAGGGSDGLDAPMAWHALGMLRSSAQCAERQLAAQTAAYAEVELDEEEEDESDV